MYTFTDSLLSKVDSLIDQLGPVTALVDKVIDRVAPQATAQACHPEGCALEECTNVRCGTYQPCNGSTAVLFTLKKTYYGPTCSNYCVHCGDPNCIMIISCS